jgi:hypothetical protein
MPVVEGCRAVDPRVVDENPVLSEQKESSFTFLGSQTFISKDSGKRFFTFGFS